MLVLTRKLGEKIVVELEDKRTIEVILVQVKGRQIRLGIKTPEASEEARMKIHRVNAKGELEHNEKSRA